MSVTTTKSLAALGMGMRHYVCWLPCIVLSFFSPFNFILSARRVAGAQLSRRECAAGTVNHATATKGAYQTRSWTVIYVKIASADY